MWAPLVPFSVLGQLRMVFVAPKCGEKLLRASFFLLLFCLTSPYLLDRSFESEINYSNPLGTGGRLAIGFAVLLRALWKGTHHAFQPSKLKVRRPTEGSLCRSGEVVFFFKTSM